MASRRARLSVGHALAWIGYALAAGSLVTDAAGSDGGPLALAAACGVAGGALGLLVPARVEPRPLLIAAAVLALLAAAAGGGLALFQQPPQLAVVAALGLAAGVHTAGIRAALVVDPALAPRVRPAPTLLAAAVGAALAAVAGLLPTIDTGVALVAAAVLQLVVIVLTASTAAHDDVGTDAGDISTPESAPSPPPAPPLLALLVIAAAGAAALAALRPGLSAIGVDDPQPAGPLALTLVLGALLGPPLAMLVDRSGGPSAAVLASIAGGAALIAPIARPGVLDWVAAGSLGVALAAVVALVELARRAGQRMPRRSVVLVVLAGAAGAGVAALLLGTVPLPDVVLGAALACLVAGVGIWVPGVGVRHPAAQSLS